MVIPMTIGCWTIVLVVDVVPPTLSARARKPTAMITMTTIMPTTVTALLTALLNPRRGRSIDRRERPTGLFRVLQKWRVHFTTLRSAERRDPAS